MTMSLENSKPTVLPTSTDREQGVTSSNPLSVDALESAFRLLQDTAADVEPEGMTETEVAPTFMTYKQCREESMTPLIFDIVVIALSVIVIIHILQGLAWWRKSTTPSGVIKFLLVISLIVVSTD